MSNTMESGAGNRVVVVDDEMNLADTLARILQLNGYNVQVFYNAPSALHQIEQDCPDIVITDVVMPEMSGVDLAVLIRQRHPFCKVLLFSGNAMTSDLLNDARQHGYEFEILAKPVHPVELLARISA